MSSPRPGIEKKIAELSNTEKQVLRSFEKLIVSGSRGTEHQPDEASFSEETIGVLFSRRASSGLEYSARRSMVGLGILDSFVIGHLKTETLTRVIC